MPRGDRTGPAGAGPMSGRRAGYCAGYGVPGLANPAAPGQTFGFWGGGRGWRHMAYATGMPGWQRFGYVPLTPQREAEALKAQVTWLKEQLDAIDKRIEELDKKEIN
jgi:hypothetical protein